MNELEELKERASQYRRKGLGRVLTPDATSQLYDEHRAALADLDRAVAIAEQQWVLANRCREDSAVMTQHNAELMRALDEAQR